MDQKNLILAIALSIGILLTFNLLVKPNVPVPTAQAPQSQPVPTPATPAVPPAAGQVVTATPGDATAPAAPRGPAPRIAVQGPRVQGSLNLRGAMLDTLELTGYRETLAPNSPLVQLFAPRDSTAGYFAQWGWSAAGDGRTRVPDGNTEWTASAQRLAPGSPVTLTWDNGQGQVFSIALALDENYMVSVTQSVRNTGVEAVTVLPWARIRREQTPELAGFYILHEGFVGVLDGRLQEWSYSSAKSEAGKRPGNPAFEVTSSAGGWAGITDKYWLTALIPARDTPMRTAFRHVSEGGRDRWQADLAAAAPLEVAAGASAEIATRLFAGAKEVATLDRYERTGITDFDKAVDFGWFYFLTKPFFYAIDFLFELFGNFGVAILVFTLCIKILFFPLQNKAYHSMAKMKLLGPKMTEIKERNVDDPRKAQAEMMQLYKTEKINPVSGCLPILIQIPVFFALYKVLFVTIEMRQAPFVGWIRDLSAPDPTNLFNLFGLLPFDPMQLSAFLHLPAWALFMGVTMYVQQKLNPQPTDPIQAKLFTYMPILFTFMLASMPAGLVVYWTWNNLLSIAQQAWITRQERAERMAARKTLALAKKG